MNSAFVLTTDEILVTVRQEAAGKSEALRTVKKVCFPTRWCGSDFLSK